MHLYLKTHFSRYARVKNQVNIAELLREGGKCTGIVRTPVGIHLNTMGRVVGPAIELLPEEMLFLIERKKLIVLDNNREMDIVEVFDVLLSSNTLLEGGQCSEADYKVK